MSHIIFSFALICNHYLANYNFYIILRYSSVSEKLKPKDREILKTEKNVYMYLTLWQSENKNATNDLNIFSFAQAQLGVQQCNASARLIFCFRCVQPYNISGLCFVSTSVCLLPFFYLVYFF